MMVAYDSHPTARLDASTIDAVRSALSRYVRAGTQTRDLHDALSGMAREARDRRIPAEQMLVTLKTIWLELPEMRSTDKSPERDRMLERLVTTCIQQYYLTS